ncbi:Flavin containing amine oxidoreductase [Nesidiocoris tenuis]|nr:Flavin containing amine oxidoreductase [Nesidiocoris tenuis]
MICTPSTIEGITGGRTDVCLYQSPTCEVEDCKPPSWSLDAIPPEEKAIWEEPDRPRANVIVIGAGLAGLAAASHLVKNQISNTIVLEASPRPGGRIKSVLLNERIVELGAPCPPAFHRECLCPVTKVAKKYGYLTHGQDDPTNGLLVNCDGSERPLPVTMMAFYEFNQIMEELQCIKYPPGEEDELVQSLLKIRLNHLMESFPEESMEVGIRTIAGLMSMITRTKIVTDAAASYFTVGTIKVPLGHTALIAPYLEQIEQDRIHYNKRVTRIKWGTVTKEQRPRAVVTCADGSSYQADYVICAIPLGVLADEIDTLFCPNLPASKSNAIAKMNVMHQEVIYLSWSLPMWVWRECPLNRIWREEDMECREGWLKGLRSVQEVPGAGNILKVNIEGPEAQAFGRMTDQEVMNEFTDFLKEWQGDPRLPSPYQMVRSSWTIDKNYRGAIPSAATPELEKIVTRPIPFGCGEDPTIFFAGDWTTTAGNGAAGNVGGAIVSGIREAQQLVALIRESHEPKAHPCFVTCCVKNPKYSAQKGAVPC